MAKMFYTLEEVCEKLGKSDEEVREMASSGQLQEFRDRDKLMFKVEQIDLLAGGDEDTDDVTIDLEGTGAGVSGLGLSASGLELADDSVIGLSDSREDTGISVFDTDHSGAPLGDSAGATGGASGGSIAMASGAGTEIPGLTGGSFGTGLSMGDDDSGETQVGAEAVDEELSLEAVGSGSGLLDLTRESDDTSLGAELLEEVYSSDDNIEIPANASGLFEAAGTESPGEQFAPAAGLGLATPMVIEAYDGSGSGWSAGAMIGALIALVCVAIMVIVGLNGATPDIAITFAKNVWVWVGAIAGATLIFALIGFFLGKASE